jgi:hypothetical protein
MVKALRIGDIKRNSADLQHALALLELNMLDGTADIYEHNLDLAVVFLLKVSPAYSDRYGSRKLRSCILRLYSRL